MDIDATEIAIRVRQADGSYQTRWVSLRELTEHMEQAMLITIRDLAREIRDEIASAHQADGSPPE